jgi:Fe(3+) dicitrate transport protein
LLILQVENKIGMKREVLKKISCVVIIIAIITTNNLALFGQKSHMISGIVVSDNLDVLPGVLMTTDKAEHQYTDMEGRFKLLATPGSIVLSFQYLGCEDVNIQVNVENRDVDLGKIQLQEKAIILKEINISTTPLPYKTSVEGTNYYISPLQLKKIQPLSTEEVLKMLPGVNVLGDMGISNRINVSIRGSWGRRSEKVLILEDGSPISPAPYTAPGIYYNPISERIDAIEVYTGADVLRYGPNNMFGIINYVTPKPPQQPAVRAKISGGQRGLFTGLLSYGGTWNKVGSQIEAVYKRFDGFTKFSSVEMINVNAKIFAELAENQSLYFKISGQFEDNQASLSSITPFTFSIDPVENPFDADRFTMHRYGLDIIHKWVPDATTNLTTKVFASDFARDWWRQNNTVLKARDVKTYLGEELFLQKFEYLRNKEFGEDDFVRVGSLRNGRESTTDSKWHFSVTSLEETFSKKWHYGNLINNFEAQIKLYKETYYDQILAADSSRWARSGRFATDLAYDLQSISGYIRNQMIIKNLSITPIIRLEKVWMNREDRLTLSRDPNITSDKDQSRVNQYFIFQPGLSVNYKWGNINLFSSVNKGFIAPSKYFAFLVERDGVLVNPLSTLELSNVQPERSINAELGLRGNIIENQLSGQLAIFNNRISNFYLAGWNEFFDKLGVINIRGFEGTFQWELLHQSIKHKLSLQTNLTLLDTRVISGELVDRHLFTQIKHTSATKKEFVDKVNANPGGYRVYSKNASGNEQLLAAPISISDLDFITKTVYIYGDDGIKDTETPYAPNLTMNVNIQYSYKNMAVGLGYNRVGDQYAEFANFENESGDGGLGKVKSFSTLDVNVNYDFKVQNMRCSFFVVGKNIGNQLFVASRLNRGQSGIMPGGFRQINAGVNILL